MKRKNNVNSNNKKQDKKYLKKKEPELYEENKYMFGDYD